MGVEMGVGGMRLGGRGIGGGRSWLPRPARDWAFVAALMLALAAGSGVLALHRHAAANFQEAALLAHLDGVVHQLRFLEGQAKQPVGAGTSPAAVEWATERAATLDEAQADLVADLSALEQIDPERAAVVRPAATGYLAAVAELGRLVAAGRVGEIEAWDDEQVDPAFASLDGLVEGEAALHAAAAERASRLADVGTIASLALAALAAGALFRRSARAAEAAALQAGSQAGLRASEQRMRALLDASPDLVFRLRRDGVCLDLHASDPSVLPTAPENIVGRRVDAFLPTDLGAMLLGKIEAALATGAVQAAEYRLELPGGAGYFEARIAPNGPDEALAVIRDVTARATAERTARATDARYRALVEQLPAVTYATPADGSWPLQFISPQVGSMLGYPADGWTRDPGLWLRSIHPDDRDRVVAARDRTIGTDEPFDLEYRMLAADGRTVWVKDEAVLMRDEAGSPAGRQGLLMDVTARKHAELALQAAEAKYRTLVERVPAVVYIEALGNDDRTWVMPYVSPQIEALLGYAPEEWVDDSTGFWRRIVHPDDLAIVLAEVERTDQTSEPFRAEYRLRHRDGHWVWVRDEAALVRDGVEGPLFWQGVMLDVTRQKEAEAGLREQAARLAAVVAAQEEVGRAALDPAAVMASALDRARALTGAERAALLETEGDALVFRAISGAVHHRIGDRLPLNGSLVGRCVNTGTAQHAPDVLVDLAVTGSAAVRASGVRSLLAVPLHDAGRVVGALAVMSPRVAAFGDGDREALLLLAGVAGAAFAHAHAHAAERAARSTAEEANRLKGEFLATMSHELRTPLTAIMGYADLLVMDGGELSPQQLDDIGKISAGADRLLGLVNDVLDLSRIEARLLMLEPRPIDVATVIAQAVDDVKPQAAAKGLAVTTALPLDLPPVLADPDRLRQVLVNLLGNAVKFTSQGGVEVTARATGYGAIDIVVADTGIGIPEEAQAWIFDAFRQADGSSTREHGGSGLGLAIVRRLTDLHGGTIAVESTRGVGSTFTVRLPEAAPAPVGDRAMELASARR